MYLRISKDHDGMQTATSRQRADCEAWIARNGAELVDVYEDVDTSAYDKRVRRPQFERLLEDVKAGGIDGVIAWKIDRIARRQKDFVRLDEAAEDVGAFIATVTEGLDTRQNRLMAELLVSFARQETANMSLRMRSKNAADFKQGKPHAGGRRPYGFTGGRERLVIPEEAECIREAARRVLAGESLNTIAKDWTARAVTTPAGNPWGADTISAMLRSPSIIGRRSFKGEVHPDRGWEPIINDDEHAQITAILGTRAARLRGPRTHHLLTGIALCGACGHPLWGSSTGRGVYRCPQGLGKGCGRTVRKMADVETVIRDIWITAIATEHMQAALRAALDLKQGTELAALHQAVRDDEAALEALSVAHFSKKLIGEAEYYAARQDILDRLTPNRARLDSQPQAVVAPGIIGATVDELASLWERAPTPIRRTLLTTIIDTVTVLPAGKGRRFAPEQIRLTWRY
jgi:DNA invertase Pin-like site-specific DNA recombinase